MSIRYVDEIEMDLEERRRINCIVKTECEQDKPFTIRNARYELIYMNEIEDSGECTVNEHEICTGLISPKNAGTYRLKYVYEIAGEIWVDNLRIKVG